MSLFGLIDYGESSSSSSESDEETTPEGTSSSNLDKESVNKAQENDEKLVLPSPLLEPSEPSVSKEFTSRTYQQTSIFYNPFKAEEKKKLDVLEKHVQLSRNVPASSTNKKRVCYKFQKGKCRFGDTCRFAHNTHIIKTDTMNHSTDDTKTPEVTTTINKTDTSYDPDMDEDQWEITKPKKRRVGVSDTLIPPKKAMKAYEQQKTKEKTWNG
jgi:hypothetical protein